MMLLYAFGMGNCNKNARDDFIYNYKYLAAKVRKDLVAPCYLAEKMGSTDTRFGKQSEKYA